MGKCTSAMDDGSTTGCNSAHEKMKSENPVDFGLKVAMFEWILRPGGLVGMAGDPLQ